ncbi:hypothetical protein BH09VER1_BH09VER1_51500 [soil metagenome]
MQTLRILLILFIAFWLLIMAGCPALFDSKRMSDAQRSYHDSPNEQTRRGLAEAGRLDHRDILIFETVLAAILALAIFAFIRAGQKMKKTAT